MIFRVGSGAVPPSEEPVNTGSYPSGVPRELSLILKEIKVITDKIRDDEEASAIESDWKFAAMVLDRQTCNRCLTMCYTWRRRQLVPTSYRKLLLLLSHIFTCPFYDIVLIFQKILIKELVL